MIRTSMIIINNIIKITAATAIRVMVVIIITTRRLIAMRKLVRIH